MKYKKIIAVAGIAASLTFVAACGSDSDDAKSTSASQSESGSSALPAGFPSDVPVVDGPYKEYESPVSGAVGLEVEKPTATTFDDAVAKLKAAGYTAESEPEAGGDTTLRTATFANDKYRVSVVSVEMSGLTRVNYNVIELAKS